MKRGGKLLLLVCALAVLAGGYFAVTKIADNAAAPADSDAGTTAAAAGQDAPDTTAATDQGAAAGQNDLD